MCEVHEEMWCGY